MTVKQPKWPLSPKMTVIDAKNDRYLNKNDTYKLNRN